VALKKRIKKRLFHCN